MFEELSQHNIHVGFSNTDDCVPPSKITINKVKPVHEGETDKRLPPAVRKHHDSYCQVCANMGCTFMADALNNSKNPELLYLTGQDKIGDVGTLKKLFADKSKELANVIHAGKAEVLRLKLKGLERAVRMNPEQKLYAPLVAFYQTFLTKKYNSEAKVHDTSAYYLDKFIIQNDLLEVFDFCN